MAPERCELQPVLRFTVALAQPRQCQAERICTTPRAGHHMIRLSNERLSFRILVIALALCVGACGQVSPNSNGTAAGEAANGSATLNWSPVTQTTDGGELSDLAGYRVFYGTAPGAMTTVVTLSDPNQITYVVANLSAGTWYFSVAAYTSSGLQGEMSNIASKTINSASE